MSEQPVSIVDRTLIFMFVSVCSLCVSARGAVEYSCLQVIVCMFIVAGNGRQPYVRMRRSCGASYTMNY